MPIICTIYNVHHVLYTVPEAPAVHRTITEQTETYRLFVWFRESDKKIIIGPGGGGGQRGG